MNKIIFSLFTSLIAASLVLGAPIENAQSFVSTANNPIDSTHPLPFVAGDALEIIAYPDTAFPSGHYPIDGQGYADFPIIGYVKVTELSASMLANMLIEKYIDYMRYPIMTIRPVIRITFNGGFFRPGHYWVDPHATLWQAVQIAGGTQRSDGYKKMKWERSNIVLDNNLATTLQDGKSLYQIGFKTGDQITMLQQPYRTKWEVFRTDFIPVLTTSLSIVISALALYNTAQYYETYRK